MVINKKVIIFVRPLYLIMLFCMMAVASSCTLFTISAFKYSKETTIEADDAAAIGINPEELFSVDDQITLAWDAPPSAVDTYKLLLRVHGTQDWSLLQDNISTAAPLEYTVMHEPALNGVWDFGVAAVDDMGEQSVVHNSLDVTADPNSGWYLIWDY
jgi:hypothetical protein